MAPPPGTLWVPDRTRQLPPHAFGVLPPESQARRPSAREYELAAPLPDAPEALPVYLGGRYPDDYHSVFARVTERGQPGWQFIPQYSLVTYRGEPLPDECPPITNSEEAGRCAMDILTAYGLLLPDYRLLQVIVERDDTWRISFARHIDGRAVYTKGTLQAVVSRGGRVTAILAHRRPLLEESTYPLRTPEEAWRLLQAGRGRALSADDGATTGGHGERFVVRALELVYVEAEPSLPRQIVQPYYLFRSQEGATLYVPAVADPYVEWWPGGETGKIECPPTLAV
jgi:hypothetical protein